MSHSLLSLVFSGQRQPSRKFTDKIKQEFGQPNIVTPEKTASSADEISLEAFERIADWVPYAILSLISIPGFRLTAHAVSKRLGIPIKQAALAIEDLKRVGYIGLDRGRWKQTVPPIRVDQSRSSGLSQRFIRSLLKKAEQSMDELPFTQRNLSSVTFSMSEHELAYAVEKIKAFRREFSEDMEKRARPDSVYSLAIQLFPLTRKKEPKA